MIDYSEEIKSRVDLLGLIKFYGFAPVHNRIPCPFHNGEDRNLSIKNNSYKCFVCGEHGDAISFVQKYFNLDFLSAISKINDDMGLGLPIGKAFSPREKTEAERKSEERRKQIAKRKERHEALQKAYENALDEWVKLDMVKRNCAPKSPDDGFSVTYVYALKHIDYAAYQLAEAENALYQFEQEKSNPL